MSRLLLIINGYVAVRTPPLTGEEQELRYASWRRIFGELADIRTEVVA